jgi:hypothetical protein
MLDATKDDRHALPPADATHGIVRCDHVMVYRRGISSLFWHYGEGWLRGSWLVLTDTGEVRLYKGKHRPDFTGKFEPIARSADQLAARRGRLLRKSCVYVRFGNKRRRLYFDGSDQGASLLWPLLGVVPYVGHVVELVHAAVELFEWTTHRGRRRDARDAWLSVLVPSRPALDAAPIPAL